MVKKAKALPQATKEGVKREYRISFANGRSIIRFDTYSNIDKKYGFRAIKIEEA